MLNKRKTRNTMLDPARVINKQSVRKVVAPANCDVCNKRPEVVKVCSKHFEQAKGF